jgi:hypothetical protein
MRFVVGTGLTIDELDSSQLSATPSVVIQP